MLKVIWSRNLLSICLALLVVAHPSIGYTSFQPAHKSQSIPKSIACSCVTIPANHACTNGQVIFTVAPAIPLVWYFAGAITIAVEEIVVASAPYVCAVAVGGVVVLEISWIDPQGNPFDDLAAKIAALSAELAALAAAYTSLEEQLMEAFENEDEELAEAILGMLAFIGTKMFLLERTIYDLQHSN